MRKTSIVLFLVLILLVPAIYSEAQMGSGPDSSMPCPMMGSGQMHGQMHGMRDGKGIGRGHGGIRGLQNFYARLLHLNLTQEQKTAVRNTKVAAMRELIKNRADLQIAMFELHDILDDDPVNLKQVESSLKNIERLRSSLHFTIISAKEQMKARLTPEQRKQLGGDESGFCPMCGMDLMHGDMSGTMSGMDDEF
jgi:Spy/CpxP family protein refolding chaperone